MGFPRRQRHEVSQAGEGARRRPCARSWAQAGAGPPSPPPGGEKRLVLSVGSLPAVVVEGEVVRVRRLEFEVLLRLARWPRRVVSTRELWDSVWPDPEGAEVGQVSWHVCHLRGRHPAFREWVVTVGGRGYALDLSSEEVAIREAVHSDL